MTGIEYINHVMIRTFLDRAAHAMRRAEHLHPRWEETGDEALEARIDDLNAQAAYWSDRAWRLAFPMSA